MQANRRLPYRGAASEGTSRGAMECSSVQIKVGGGGALLDDAGAHQVPLKFAQPLAWGPIC